eukprot:CAMPEP_0168341436 /NCGR_PEP_ID=MMETSP0213-20121227/14690_1 /TAXON_ID=151035 /ORGANISM="Euplotes harpa, Strain FSP1.4" /LENGTH=236 /DNA_ID=CAMNT_0008347927 /DNA_START=65 /DNA_END=776 /DNA_ORIENTATION=+
MTRVLFLSSVDKTYIASDFLSGVAKSISARNLMTNVHYVAVQGEEVLGKMMLKTILDPMSGGKSLWLFQLFVAEHARGKGVCRMLVQKAVEVMQADERIVNLNLGTHVDNNPDTPYIASDFLSGVSKSISAPDLMRSVHYVAVQGEEVLGKMVLKTLLDPMSGGKALWLYQLSSQNMREAKGMFKLFVQKAVEVMQADERIVNIQAVTYNDNKRAQTVFEKLGFAKSHSSYSWKNY